MQIGVEQFYGEAIKYSIIIPCIMLTDGSRQPAEEMAQLFLVSHIADNSLTEASISRVDCQPSIQASNSMGGKHIRSTSLLDNL